MSSQIITYLQAGHNRLIALYLPYMRVFALWCLMRPLGCLIYGFLRPKLMIKNALLPYMSTSGRVNSIFWLFWVLFKTKTVCNCCDNYIQSGTHRMHVKFVIMIASQRVYQSKDLQVYSKIWSFNKISIVTFIFILSVFIPIKSSLKKSWKSRYP